MSEFPQFDGRLLVVFDGQCGFCNRSIRWLLRRDSHDRLRFAPSSHPKFAGLMAQHRIPESGPDSLLVFRNADEPPLTRSQAMLACLREMPQPWPTVAAIARLIPRPLRDLVYRFIGRIRYRISGRYSVCPIPTAAERAHFL